MRDSRSATTIRPTSSVQHHIIRREILEVATAGTESDGFVLQGRIADLCRDWLGPALEETLDRIAPEDEYWSIDNLIIDAGSFTADSLERDFVGAVTAALAREIDDRAAGRGGALHRAGQAGKGGWLNRRSDVAESPEGIERRTRGQSLHEAFLHFLATGMLPWWFRLPDGQTLEQALTASWQPAGPARREARALVQAIASSGMRIRLVRQFSPSFLNALVGAVAPEGVRAVHATLAAIERLELPVATARPLAEELWQVVVLATATGRGPAAAVAEWLHRVSTREGPGQQLAPLARALAPIATSAGRSDEAAAVMPAAPEPPPAIPREEPGSSIDLNEGLFVECAGLVLLHLFLPRLFVALGIAVEDVLVQPDRALCVLHFLATGERRPPEYALALPKLLCGLRLDEPVGAPCDVTAEEEDEATALLAAVIGHWKALGSSSVDELRGTFLVRSGKLIRRGDGDVLQVAPHTFDVLLHGLLPWGLNAIKLPWMTSILWVEWTN